MALSRFVRPAAGALLLLVACGGTVARGAVPWRFWNAADGMREGYSASVAQSRDGRLWIKHGNGLGISSLDGYTISSVAAPGTMGQIVSSAGGDIWAFDGDGIRLYSHGRWSRMEMAGAEVWRPFTIGIGERWQVHAPGASPRFAVDLAALERDRCLFLLPDRLVEADANTHLQWVVKLAKNGGIGNFISLYHNLEGSLWVTGEHGVARLTAGSDAASFDWSALPAPAGLTGFERLFQSPDGSLLAIAVQGGVRVVVNGDGGKWQVIYRSSGGGLLLAWRDGDGELWIADNDRLLRLNRGVRELLPRTAALEGYVLNIQPGRDGTFWVGTSHGLVRYTPALWRTPADLRVEEMDTLVNNLTQGSDGSLWGLAAYELVRYQAGKLSRYRLPDASGSEPSVTNALYWMPDGRLAVALKESADLLLFDPRSERFSPLRHPRGWKWRLFGSTGDHRVLVETIDPRNYRRGRLELLDGHTVKVFLDADYRALIGDLRAIWQDDSGEVWLGGTTGLVSYRKGKFRRWGARDGYADRSAMWVGEAGGKLMAGGENGFYRFDGSRWQLLHEGLDRVRSAIAARDGTVWVASGTGVHRLRGNVWITHTADEGLPSAVTYKVFEDRDRRVWAGGTRGVARYDPNADLDPPHTLIAEENNSHRIAPDGQVRLVFSGIDKWKHTPPERLLFSYRLDGGNWTRYGDEHAITFRGLSDGAHRFEVRAMDRNGNADPQSASFAFSVMVPWYKTHELRWLAGVALAMILGLLVWAVVNFIRRGRLIGQLETAHRLEEQRKQLLEAIAQRRSLDAILQLVAEAACDCSPACGAMVSLLEGERLRAAAGHALPEGLQHLLEQPARRDAAGATLQALESGEITTSSELATAAGAPPQVVAVPILSGSGCALGVIEVFAHHGGDTTEMRSRYQMLARIAATAIENAQLYDLMTEQARIDPLTRLPNRRSFGERLEAMIGGAHGEGDSFALLCIDLDRFKQINDSLGHGVGDEFLKHVAARLAFSLRPGDMLGRIGGDEFMILLERIAGTGDAQRVAERLLATLRPPVWIAGNELFPSASIGIGMFPEHGEDAATLQKNADAAMYRAKQLGRNRYECFSIEMSDEAGVRLRVETQLRHGLERGHFELWYQPQYTFTGELSGVEALVRLRDPEKGLILPGEFIPVAEDSGLILPLGEWVLREACRQRKVWEDAGCAPIRIGVNVSALQFEQRNFASMVASILEEHGIAGTGIELELTEHTLMLNLEESQLQMQKLRALGVAMALDDFGTGYASLTQLHRLPLDVLKVDKRFVDEIDTPAGTLPLVKSIVHLAHNIGLRVIAEGVERTRQHELLAEIGCDVAQGFLLARPLPAAQVEPVLRNAATGMRKLSAALDAAGYSPVPVRPI